MYKVCHVYDHRSLYFNHIASWRLRVQIPKDGLRKHGIMSYNAKEPTRDAVNVFHKFFVDKAPEWIKSYGGIYDIVDDNFSLDVGDYCRDMCINAPIVTCSTEGMRKRVEEEAGRDSIVIWDSYDSNQFKKASPEYKDTKSVCWFGSETNLYTLIDIKLPCRADLVTHSGIQEGYAPDLLRLQRKGWNYIPWVSGIMPNIFKRHDVVVIPYGNSPKQHAKSPNRIVDSLRSGMIVVTNDTPVVDSYGLREFCVINNNISDGIESVWLDPENAIQKVIKGQEYIEKNLSPEVIAGQWAEVIKNQC